ncbi:effector-associated domain 2-containing protein [Actinocorallia aurantiaca]|uniref:Uncharacterized protein n=1 Tax=Actinocorallia aurantiaca TaxID=46204 RepID=A0ABN3UBN3_9ACTN
MPSWLDHSEAHRLVLAFLQIGAMRKRRTRDLFLATLNRQLGHVLPVSRHDEDMFDMYEIVDACLAYPGAVHALLAIVEKFHEGSRSVKAVRELVEELLPEPLLEPSERRDLYQLARVLESGALGPDDLAMLPLFYREAVGEFGPPLDRVVHSIRDVLAHLEEVPARADDTVPLLWFTGLLAGRAQQDTAAALHSWNERLALRLGMEIPRLSAVPSGRAEEECAYLIIECRPDGADPNGYITSAWLQFSYEQGISLLREDSPRYLHELPELLESLLVQNPQVVNRHVDELTIEFVLPRDLLGLPFDQYQYAPSRFPRRLGLDHPVVVRSLERMRDQQLRRACQRKWNWFRQNSEDAVVTWVVRPDQYGLEQLYALLSEHSQTCLAMSHPPREGPDPVDELHVCLQAGTPIVLWCRVETAPEDFVPGLRELLATDLMSLPRKIQDLRRHAAQLADATHLGNHLTLLFEDADRLPEPYIRFRSPN